ncbi:MAG TPA: acetyltransferase [Steroidobacteraceae bacterium]|nr:acetyltransferase [Steroidobacteraceae bacterium]
MSGVESVSLPLFGIYGASGCGRGILPVAAQMLTARLGNCAYELVFVDDDPPSPTVNGRRVLTYREFVASDAQSRAMCIAISNSRVRERLLDRCVSDGVDSLSVRASNVVVLDEVVIGEGAILAPFVTLTSNIRIGRQFHANIYSYVEHDCVIGDFVTFAPAVHCNGNVVIEDHAYLGAGSVLRQGTPAEPLVIGRGAVIGMGAVVTRSVAAGATIVGNPARPLREA